MKECCYFDSDGTCYIIPTDYKGDLGLIRSEVFHWNFKITCNRCGFVVVDSVDESAFFLERFINNYICKNCFKLDGILCHDFKLWIECSPDERVEEYTAESYLGDDVYLEDRIYGKLRPIIEGQKKLKACEEEYFKKIR